MAPRAPEPAPEGPSPEARRRLIETILDYPGLRQVDLAHITGLAASLTEYHLEALLDAELVVERDVEGQRRFYPISIPGAPSVADAEWLGLLRERIPLRVVFALVDGEVASHTALTEAAGVAKSTLSHHLGKMVEVGLVVRTGAGYRLADTARVRALLVRHRPVPDALDAHLTAWLRLYQEAGRARLEPRS